MTSPQWHAARNEATDFTDQGLSTQGQYQEKLSRKGALAEYKYASSSGKSVEPSSTSPSQSNSYLSRLQNQIINMKGFTLIAASLTALAGFTAAAPLEDRQLYAACSGLYGTAQCCATDILGVADLDCGNRKFSRLLVPEDETDGLQLPTFTSRPTSSLPSAPPLGRGPVAVSCRFLTRAFCAIRPLVSTTRCSVTVKPGT